jgi:cystathionine beta-lyase/cystathionine gamma-synthase
MSAISAAIMLLKSGDHLIATEGLYGGSFRVLTQVFNNYEISHSFVNTGDIAEVRSAFHPNTRAVLLETPANPLMGVTDIAITAALVHEQDALLIVDNTFMSPVLQKPIELGADVVVHSATKFLGGHSDLVLGLAATSDVRLADKLKHLQNAVGAVPSPFDCWLLMRGMKTLSVRIERSQENAEEICRWLLTRDEVEEVFYPGIETSAGFEIHARQARGPGSVISFRMKETVKVDQFLKQLQVWTLAVSLGAIESIITQPACMTHLPYPEQEKKRLGIDKRLIRLSVGIEAVTDLIDDLECSLVRAQ